MTESEALNFFKNFIDIMKINGEEQILKNDYCKASNIAINALEENQQYKELGTVEELRIAKEKQISKKVVKWTDGTEHCPTCDFDNSCIGYGVCIDCGQKLDWSDTD